MLHSKNEIIFLGGISNHMWIKDGKRLSRNYKQGYRLYDSKGIASSLVSQAVGGLGGYTGLYLVYEKRNNNV